MVAWVWGEGGWEGEKKRLKPIWANPILPIHFWPIHFCVVLCCVVVGVGVGVSVVC